MATTTLVRGARSTRSTIALKLLMAVSGLVFIAYVLLHMYGNLKAFAGHDAYNEYAHHLRTIGEPMLPESGLLWVLRVVLVLALVAHVYAAVALWRRAGKARTQRYQVKRNRGSSFSSRLDALGRRDAAALRHLAPAELHRRQGQRHRRRTNDPYNLLVDSFGVWWLTLIYLVAMLALALHLHHGTWSAAQTLGLTGTAVRAPPGQGRRLGARRRHRRRLLARPARRALRHHHEVRTDPWPSMTEPVPSTSRPTQLSDDARGYYTPGEPLVDPVTPTGPIKDRWTQRKFDNRLVNPANRRKMSVIIVGTGLAGGAAAATLGEAGYHVKSFCYQDSPRRAHSIAAQGGINAAKNYKEDGDSVFRLFYDTVKGGDYRSRESNVYRLAEVSANIIDQCVAQGVPFARDYGGLLDNRSFGGVQVSRTFYARGQTGQQLLIGAYQAMERQVAAGTVEQFTRHEMLELIVVDGKARGIIARDLVTGEIETHLADAVVLASGGYGNVFYLSTNAMGSNVTATWRAHRKGAYMANPCYTQIHPTCIPVAGEHQSKLTLMSESLRNDGRIWVPKNAEDCTKDPRDIPEEDRDYYLERIYPSFGNLVPRDIASRQAKNMCDEGRGVGPMVGDFRRGVYLDFADAIERLGEDAIREKYDNLFDMYERITGENPYQVPMRIYPAVHYVMGGLWVDYHLQSNIPGLFVTGEANFSDHGANRLGASALMQGLADGYFVLPNTIRDYLADAPSSTKIDESHPAVVEAQASVEERVAKFLSINGTRSADSFHKELGQIMWEYCGMERSEEGLRKAIDMIRELKAEFWTNLKVLGTADSLNQSLEKAGRVADFIELGELMCIDALNRRESCGGHFRAESQTEDGEALRDDDEFAYVAAWEFGGEDGQPVLHKEDLIYTAIEMKQRSYK